MASATTTAAAATAAVPGTATFSGLEIPVEEIVLEEPLSQNEEGEEIGQYGKVYKGSCYGLEVAVKIPQIQNLNERQLDDFKTEVKIMSEISHPNIVRFLGACLQPGKFCLVTELLKGNLGSLLSNKQKQFSLFARMKMAQDIVKGMIFVHQMSIIHEDLKPDNLLFDENYRIKISDFGFSEFKPRGFLLQRNIAKGSYLWMAPEVMLKKPFNEKVDVYSFGVILWQLLTRLEPYSHHNKVDQFIRAVAQNGERPAIPDTCLPSLRLLMQRCWDEAPKKRPSFLEVDQVLQGILIETAVQDAVGRAMWEQHFRHRDAVPWPEFVRAFYAAVIGAPVPEDIQFEPPQDAAATLSPEQQLAFLSDQDLEAYAMRSPEAHQLVYAEVHRRDAIVKLNCLQELLVDKALGGKDGGDEHAVELERFGRMLNLFGPIQPTNTVAVLEKMQALMQKEWFHGELNKDEAFSMLKDQEAGAFLVRFSSNPLQAAFVISLVHQRNVVHIRVSHTPGRGFCLVGNAHFFRSLEDLILQLPLLKTPCPPVRRTGRAITRSKNAAGGYKMLGPPPS